jgi:hypothetical protein
MNIADENGQDSQDSSKHKGMSGGRPSFLRSIKEEQQYKEEKGERHFNQTIIDLFQCAVENTLKQRY